MRCHFIYDKEAGKVLIPECWPVVHTGRMENCTCRSGYQSFAKFEKERFNGAVAKLEAEISGLEKENARLNRLVKKILVGRVNTQTI